MKFLKWLAVIIIAVPVLLITGIYVRNKSVGPVGWAEDNTIKALKERMKDPDSMVVRSSYFVIKSKTAGEDEIAMCGVVDGKNSFGGYSGGARFVSVSMHSENTKTFDTYIIQLEDASASDKTTARRVHMLTGFESVYWNGHCVDDTHPALVPEA